MFLLARSLKDPDVMGHALFWYFKSELDIEPQNLRLRFMLEQFMLLHSAKSHGYFRQCDLVQSLLSLALLVKRSEPAKRNEVLREGLTHLHVPSGCILPVNPATRVGGVIAKKCKCLDSFTTPLWLVFENLDPEEEPVYIIFKTGDDLRQDALTIQMLQIMDNVSALDMTLPSLTAFSFGDRTEWICI